MCANCRPSALGPGGASCCACRRYSTSTAPKKSSNRERYERPYSFTWFSSLISSPIPSTGKTLSIEPAGHWIIRMNHAQRHQISTETYFKSHFIFTILSRNIPFFLTKWSTYPEKSVPSLMETSSDSFGPSKIKSTVIFYVYFPQITRKIRIASYWISQPTIWAKKWNIPHAAAVDYHPEKTLKSFKNLSRTGSRTYGEAWLYLGWFFCYKIQTKKPVAKKNSQVNYLNQESKATYLVNPTAQTSSDVHHRQPARRYDGLWSSVE